MHFNVLERESEHYSGSVVRRLSLFVGEEGLPDNIAQAVMRFSEIHNFIKGGI